MGNKEFSFSSESCGICGSGADISRHAVPVDNILSAGYGSRYDGNMYIVMDEERVANIDHFCDKCIRKMEKKKAVVHFGSYISGTMDTRKLDVEVARKLFYNGALYASEKFQEITPIVPKILTVPDEEGLETVFKIMSLLCDIQTKPPFDIGKNFAICAAAANMETEPWVFEMASQMFAEKERKRRDQLQLLLESLQESLKEYTN